MYSYKLYKCLSIVWIKPHVDRLCLFLLPSHFVRSLPLSVITLPFLLPLFPINPITVREMLNRNRNDREGRWEAGGERVHRGDRTVWRDGTDTNS